MLDTSGTAESSRVSFDSQLVSALNKLDFIGAQQALIALIKQTVGIKSSWSSPQYATSRAIQQSITLDHSRSNLLTFFALDTLRDRYFLRDSEGVICETPQDFFARVATGVACAEKTEAEVSKLEHKDFDEIAAYAQKLYDAISQLHALFATPILTNAGTNRGHLISCLTGDMLIATPDGFYPIKDIEIGDKVLTHKGRWRRVLAKRVKTADDVYSLVVDKRRTSIEITGNHPVLTERGWIRVDQLDLEKDKVAINWKVSDEDSAIQKLDFTAYCPYAAEVRNLEGVGAPVISALSVRTSRFDKQKSRWKANAAQPIASVDIDEEVAWALGLWFAEGSLGIDAKKQPNAVRITVGHDEQHLAERWLRVMKEKFNINGSMYESSIVRNGKSNRWISATASSKAVACYFAGEFGTSCKEKSVPGWFLRSPNEVLESFLNGFLDGDGCEHTTGNTEYNSLAINNPTLLGSLYNITLKLGMDVSIKLDKKAGKLASRPTVQEMRIPRAGFMAKVPKRSLESSAVQFSSIISLSKIEGSHKVYDIQVEEDESFTVAGVVVHNCFLNESDDSIRDIFSTYEENAVLAQGGGGIGTYWGKLRGQGAKLSRGGKSSGPLPFLKVFDSATLAVHQAGARRGAAAAYIDVSHPDIEDFVDMRRPEGAEERRCQNVHHGICITDAFMRAVADRKPWDLIDPHHKNVVRTIDAYGLWKRIIMTRVMTGEPYLLFVDTVNKLQPQAYKDKNLEVKTSNLCIEVTLPTKPGADGRTAICCLGSINFATYEQWKGYGPELHYLMVRGLDNVLEHFIRHAGPGYEKAVHAAKNGRDIGLGAMGWFDYLQQRTIPFESVEARVHNKMRFKEFGLWSDNASLKLAEERGAAPDGGPYRNVNRQAIAPTATIGIIAGASPSIEPPAGNVYRQETLSGKYIVRNPSLERLLANKYPAYNNEQTWQSITESGGSVQHLDWMEDDDRKTFKTAYELNQRELVQQAADRQPNISQSQSLNLFFAPGSSGTLSASYLHDVHFMAWELGVKSLYYCRSESVIKAANTSSQAKIQQIMDRISTEECTVCQ